jgi:hypothetical protein
MATRELGNLRILNVTTTLTAGTEDDFVFTVPAGGVAELNEATYHLKRDSALTDPGEGGSEWTSEDVIIKKLEVTKVGESERKNLLSGTPNIKEFGGDGKLTRLFTVVETLENNEDIVITVRNNDAVDVRVSLTLNLKIVPRPRRIAAQPAERTPVDQ